MTYPATFEIPTSDNLTGLLNSMYFRHLVREKLLPEAQTSGEPLSLFLLDMDSFYEINRQYGRECGDQLIKAVAEVLTQTLPETTVLARYGGDEFSGVFPETRLDDAFTLMEEVRRRIVALRLEQWPEVAITSSIGLASYPAHGSNDIEIFREADQACYLAKSTGRNKVSLPLADSRMITKTSHYTAPQLERLNHLARAVKRNEASLLREALDDLLKKYNDLLKAAPKQ